jgi:hypothetical protein
MSRRIYRKQDTKSDGILYDPVSIHLVDPVGAAAFDLAKEQGFLIVGNDVNEPVDKLTARAVESNGVAGGSHPPPARDRDGRSLGPTTPSNGSTHRTKSRAGSSRASTPSPRRKARTVEESGASTPDLAALEAQIAEVHSQFLASFRTSLGHARRVGQLLLTAKEQLGHGKFADWLDRPRRPFARATANGYMRIARYGAILDEDAKHQSAGDMTLAAALRRLAKPRAKGTADENSGTNTSTSSTRSTSGGQAGADAGGRPAAATESAEAHREAAHEDGDRRRDEDGADGRRAEAETARDDDEATAQDPDATTVPEGQLDDEQWLSIRPVRKQLADPTAFDHDALVWRRTWPEVERMIRRLEARRPGLLEEVEVKGSPFCRYAPMLMRVIRYPHPDNWRVCPTCKGRGRRGRQEKRCGMCWGAGYETWLMTH